MTSAPSRPRSCRDLFLSFMWMALQGFGGVLAVVQRELVDKQQWLTREQFIEDWSVAQALPGPNVINLSIMIGSREFGLRGALASLAGLLLVPGALALSLAAFYDSVAHTRAAQAALRGMGAVVAGMVIATGLKLLPALRSNPLGFGLGLAWAGLSFVCVALLRMPLIWVLLGLGGLSCAWAARQLRRIESAGRP
ncbi:MAG: chromate transporter [Alphaproteobacteria bacterium]|nr:chromate transporter [Alphaproteobacteria bacterium]